MTERRLKVARTLHEPKLRRGFDFEGFLNTVAEGKTVAEYTSNEVIFSQGEPCNEVCYLDRGRVKISAISKQGKEAVIAIAEQGQFFGEECLIGRAVHCRGAG